jgi:hypothetical protein
MTPTAPQPKPKDIEIKNNDQLIRIKVFTQNKEDC